MTKKRKLLFGAGLGIVLAVVVAVGLLSHQKTNPAVGNLPTPSPKIEEMAKLVKYEDEAGFSFEYPEDLVVKDVTPEDNLSYSVLEIGKTIIKVVDTRYSSVDNWLVKDPSASSGQAGTSREVTLAGMAASQIQFDNPRRLVTVTIENRVMYFIESPLESAGQYWNKVHNAIVGSFSLTESASPPSASGGEQSIVEEEEIIE